MKKKQTNFKFPTNEVRENHKNNMQVCIMTMFLVW